MSLNVTDDFRKKYKLLYSILHECINLKKDEDQFFSKMEIFSISHPDEKKWSDFGIRSFFVEHFAWAIPSKNAIREIKTFAKNDRILEIGSGRGLWAFLLQQQNVNIKATDAKINYDPSKVEDWTHVEKMHHIDAIENYGDHEILMLCWPTLNGSHATASLMSFKGDKLIYIGESKYGCTADDCFFILLNSDWDLVSTHQIDNWQCIHDRMSFYKRKKKFVSRNQQVRQQKKKRIQRNNIILNR